MSRLTKKLVLVVAVVAALAVAAAVALAAGSLTARNHSTAQPRLSEDTASMKELPSTGPVRAQAPESRSPPLLCENPAGETATLHV